LIQNLLNSSDKLKTIAYFLTTIANLLFITLSMILTIFIIFVGVSHNFSETSLSKSEEFEPLLVSITTFVFASVFTLFGQIICRLLLPSDLFENSHIDTFFNIEAIQKFIYIWMGWSSGECMETDRFKLSYETPPELPESSSTPTPTNDPKDLFDKIKQIFEPKSTLIQIWLFFILYGLFVLFPSSISSFSDTPHIYHAYRMLIATFAALFIPVFIFYGFNLSQISFNSDTISWGVILILLSIFIGIYPNMRKGLILPIILAVGFILILVGKKIKGTPGAPATGSTGAPSGAAALIETTVHLNGLLDIAEAQGTPGAAGVAPAAGAAVPAPAAPKLAPKLEPP
jgi:hypothetical protein